MKEYPTEQLRNIGIVGHSVSGKTSLTESMLLHSGLLKRLGHVEDGSTVTDYLPKEIKRHASVSACLAPIEWNGKKLNMVDTPGYADFIGEVISTASAVEQLLFVICGVSGIEVQTEILWDLAEQMRLPRMIFINKLEREHACFKTVVEQLREQYGTSIVPLQLPIGKEADFCGFIDLIHETAYRLENGTAKEIPIPEDYLEEYETQRTYLIEVAAESCDELLLNYLEGNTPTKQELCAALRSGIAHGEIFPVLGGSVFKDIGITALLDLCCELSPAPAGDPSAPPSAIVYKTVSDPFVGKLSFLKIKNGPFQVSDGIWNSTRSVEEKSNPFMIPCGKQSSTISIAHSGDLIAISKLQHTKTGDTLTIHGASVPEWPAIPFPSPNISMALRPNAREDEDKMSIALARLLEEDSSLSVEKNPETQETILSGVGETHLDVVAERFQHKFGIAVTLQPIQIPYRETIRKTVEVQGKHKKQSGGAGQYGDVWLRLEPYADGDFLFAKEVFGGAVPKNYFPAVEKGVREAMQQGTLAGYPLCHVKVTLYDGSYHPVDSNEMAFKTAASLGFKKGAELVDPVLLEPMMLVTVTIPEIYTGDIIGDLTNKRGRILGMEPTKNPRKQKITAQVPLAEMQQYIIDLKAITQGRGIFSMQPDHYEEVPSKIAETIIAAKKK